MAGRVGEMATEAGGTHPTGMHSCLGNILVLFTTTLSTDAPCIVVNA